MSAAGHLRVVELAAFGLLRRPGRLATVVAVYALLVAVAGSLLLYVEAMREQSRLLLAGGPDVLVQRLAGGRPDTIPLARAEAIRRLPGVRAVEPRVWGYVHDAPTGATVTIWGMEGVPAARLHLEEGAAPSPGGGECAVGQGLAAARLLEVGERLPLPRPEGGLFAPRVAGVFSSGSAILTNDLVVVTEADARRLFSLPPGEATDLAVYLDDPAGADALAREVQARWADGRTVTAAQLLATYDAVFDWRGGLWAGVLLLVVAAFVVLVWDVASGLSSDELRTLGLLKAVGWTSREVMALRAWQGAIVSVVSCATGLLAAMVHVVGFDGVLVAGAIKGWSVLFPAFPVHPRLDAYALLLCLALTVLPYTAASLVPAWRAAVSDPDAVMRS